MSDKSPSIVFLIRQLNWGGAQRQIVEVIKALQKLGMEAQVLTFYPGGAFWEELQRLHPSCVRSAGKKGRFDLSFIFRLRKELRELQPQVLMTYFETGNVLGALLCPPESKLIWNVRRSTLEKRGLFHRLLAMIEDLLSKVPRRIICNSDAGRRYVSARGWPAESLRVIPNGVDLERFIRTPDRGSEFRTRHNIDSKTVIVTLPARLHPVKNHELFFDAARIFRRDQANVLFICAGTGTSDYIEELQAKAKAREVDDCVVFIAADTEMTGLYNASQLVTLTSFDEGFPNVVIEALACGTPAVTVDVGDCREVIGNCGEVVAADPIELAQAWGRVLSERSETFSSRCRERIESRYSREKLIERLLQELTGWN